MNDKKYSIPVTEEAYKRIVTLIKRTKEDSPVNRLQRRELVSFAINKITEEEAIELGRKNRKIKDVLKSYLTDKESDPSPEELISILQQQISKKY